MPRAPIPTKPPGDNVLAALAAYKSGVKIRAAAADSGISVDTLYWWINHLNIPKRGVHPRQEPGPNVKAAIEAYSRCDCAEADVAKRFNTSLSVLHIWINRLNVEKRGRAIKTKPKPIIRAAIVAYERGDSIASIMEQFGVSHRILYIWCDRLRVPRRQPQRPRKTGKAGRPMLKPWQTDCDWCGGPLSLAHIKRRRKYCSNRCQQEGIEAIKQGKWKPCQAPGCNEKAWKGVPYCSWACFKTTMEARFG